MFYGDDSCSGYHCNIFVRLDISPFLSSCLGPLSPTPFLACRGHTPCLFDPKKGREERLILRQIYFMLLFKKQTYFQNVQCLTGWASDVTRRGWQLLNPSPVPVPLLDGFLPSHHTVREGQGPRAHQGASCQDRPFPMKPCSKDLMTLSALWGTVRVVGARVLLEEMFTVTCAGHEGRHTSSGLLATCPGAAGKGGISWQSMLRSARVSCSLLDL